MKSFNLSSWSLAHPSLIAYFMLVLTLGGVLAYFNLGRSEDPDFTIKIMVVRTFWPGASAREVEQQVTDRIEKKLQELPFLDNLRSYSKPGESMVFVELRDFTPPKQVPELWYQVRKKINDMRQTLPAGVHGPFPNDEFGDAFGNVFALTGDGYTLAELRRQADRIALELRRVPDVAKVDLIGVQDERIWIEMSAAKLATLGLDPRLIQQTLQAQNAMTPSGYVDSDSERIRIRVSGSFDSVEAIRAIGMRAGDKLFKLGDVAKVWRGYADPPQPHFRWRGRPAVGLALSMTRGRQDSGCGVADSVSAVWTPLFRALGWREPWLRTCRIPTPRHARPSSPVRAASSPCRRRSAGAGAPLGGGSWFPIWGCA